MFQDEKMKNTRKKTNQVKKTNSINKPLIYPNYRTIKL